MHTLLPPASVTSSFFDNFWFRSEIPRLRKKQTVPKFVNLKAGRQNQNDKLQKAASPAIVKRSDFARMRLDSASSNLSLGFP
jgi:hypothetical protein